MKQFLSEYHSSFLAQFITDISLGSVLAVVLQFVRQYLFSDIEFAKVLAVMIGIDTLLGIILSFRSGTISSKGFGMVLKKIVAYGAVLFVIHALTSFPVNGEKNSLFDWFTQIGYGALVVREAISILENAGKLAPGLVPTWILKRLKGFDKSGKPEDLNGAAVVETQTNNTSE